MRKLDRAGLLDLNGENPEEAIVAMTELPPEVITAGLEATLKRAFSSSPPKPCSCRNFARRRKLARAAVSEAGNLGRPRATWSAPQRSAFQCNETLHTATAGRNETLQKATGGNELQPLAYLA